MYKIAFTVLLLIINSHVCYGKDAQKIDHYQIINGGLVKDLDTGLIWMRCPLGMKWNGKNCQGKTKEYGLEEAMLTPINFSYANYNDWRVPSIKELETIIDNKVGNIQASIPYINTMVFPTNCKEDNCFAWSSSRHSDSADYAWIVAFETGKTTNDDGLSGGNSVRLVRNP